MQPTKEQIMAYLQVIRAVADTIREACQRDPNGWCPAGPVFAALQAHGCSLERYQGIIGKLQGAGMVEATDGGTILKWVGPTE